MLSHGYRISDLSFYIGTIVNALRISMVIYVVKVSRPRHEPSYILRMRVFWIVNSISCDIYLINKPLPPFFFVRGEIFLI